MDWRSAFIAQAASDYHVAALLKEKPGVPLCHVLHYMQMSLEKFSKGLMTPPGSMVEPTHSHHGPAALIHFLNRQSPLTKAFHRELAMNHGQRNSYLIGLLPEVQFLEQITPAIANRAGTLVNAEYPWLLPARPPLPEEVVAPVHYPFSSLRRTKLPKLLQLIGTITRSYSS
jgi:hypothetical protein